MSNHQQWLVNSDFTRDNFKDHVDKLYADHGYVMFTWSTGRQRSDQQRKAIEVYCRELAKALNDAGLDQRKVLAAMREGVEIPWRQDSVKCSLWKEIQQAVIKKDSTTQLNRDEVSQIHDVLNRWTSQTFGVSVPFPEREDD